MSLKPITTLTPKLSAQARRELGLSQNDVIRATGIQAYKLKQYESRHIQIELADLRKLSDFYAAQGVDLDELAAHLGNAAGQPAVAEGSPTADQPALKPGYTYTPRPGFFISDQLPAEVVDQLMIQMEVNDDRVAELVSTSYETGLFGNPTAATESKVRELFGSLAQSHLIFRALQGRSIVSPNQQEPDPKTIGDFLANWLLQSDAASLLPSEPAKDQAKKPAPLAQAGA